MHYIRFQTCALAALLGFVTSLPAIVCAQTAYDPKPCTHPHLLESAKVAGYVFKAYRDTDYDSPGCVRVYFGGKLVYQLSDGEGMTYSLGQPRDANYKIPFVPNGTNIFGNGQPDMIVTAWSGGAHCCFTRYIFELEPKLRLFATLKEGDTSTGHFEDLDHNGRYFYVTYEIWSYWPDSFSGSVSHKVILKWNKGKFRLDLDRMKFAPPTPEQWKAALKEVDDAAEDRSSLGVALWDPVLDLIYTGHSDLAWQFVQQVNPNALKGNNPSLQDFCSMLKSGAYWHDLEPTLKDVPEECAKAKTAN